MKVAVIFMHRLLHSYRYQTRHSQQVIVDDLIKQKKTTKTNSITVISVLKHIIIKPGAMFMLSVAHK